MTDRTLRRSLVGIPRSLEKVEAIAEATLQAEESRAEFEEAHQRMLERSDGDDREAFWAACNDAARAYENWRVAAFRVRGLKWPS